MKPPCVSWSLARFELGPSLRAVSSVRLLVTLLFAIFNSNIGFPFPLQSLISYTLTFEHHELYPN